MNLPRTVADVIAEHTVFEMECVDRMYLNVYVPQLQYAAGIVGYVRQQLGLPIASTAPLGKITDAFSAAIRLMSRARDEGLAPEVRIQEPRRAPAVDPYFDPSHPHTAPSRPSGPAIGR